MNWPNLKENKCPKCGKDFMHGLETIPTGKVVTLLHYCGFKISETRYKEIVNDMVRRGIDRKFEDEGGEQ